MFILIKVVYEIDNQGFIIERRVGEFVEEVLVTDFDGRNIITSDLPYPLEFFKPKWNGVEWVEGEPEEEKANRDAQQALMVLQPTAEELANAEFEIKVIKLLSELEVF